MGINKPIDVRQDRVSCKGSNEKLELLFCHGFGGIHSLVYYFYPIRRNQSRIAGERVRLK